MGTLTELRRSIRRNPGDKLGAKVYADFLCEYQGYTRWAALRAAGEIRRSEVNADQIQKALRLIDRGGFFRPALEYEIRSAAGIADDYSLELLIVAGSRPPTARITELFTDGESIFWMQVTVGARWIIEAVRAMPIVLGTTDVGELTYQSPN